MGKSMRALHWAESKHPRDDRGRFAHKGGGKWMERVGEKAKASFGDLSLGYEPGRGPAGRLQTGKGGLIDIGGLSKAAKAAKAARTPEPPAGGHSGGREKVNPQSLSVGDRFLNAHGVEHEVISNPTSGRRAGAAVTRVKVRRVVDGKEGPLTLDGPVELAGGKSDTPESGKGLTAQARPAEQIRAAQALMRQRLDAAGGSKDSKTRVRVAREILAEQPGMDSRVRAFFEREIANAEKPTTAEGGIGGSAQPGQVAKLRQQAISAQTRYEAAEGRLGIVRKKGDNPDLERRMEVRRDEALNQAREAQAALQSAKAGPEAPKAGRTAAGKVDTPRVSDETNGVSTTEAVKLAQTSTDPNEVRQALAGMSLADVKAVHAQYIKERNADGGAHPYASNARTRQQIVDELAGNVQNRRSTNAILNGGTERSGDVGRTASGTKVETPTGVDRVMKARSNKEKSAAFAALSSDEIVEAFQRDPGKALDAYMQKNFGKGSGRETALPPAVDNVAANLKAKNITPDQAAEQMRQWARVHAGMQHHKYMTLAADLTDGTVAKRRGAAGPTRNADGGGGPGTKSAGASFLDEFKGDDNQLAKDTARGPRVPGSKLPTTAGGNIKPTEARAANREARNANLDKARTAQREMRADELRASHDPKQNSAKIRALEGGTIASAELYRKAAAGPSGQRTDLLVGRVSHTPNNPAGEFNITDRDGNHTGWASRTVRQGEPVYVFHSEGPQGEQRLEGWSDSLAIGADVLNNGHHQATGYGLDSTRTSGGTFERYAGKNKSIAELDREALDQEIRRVRERLANPDLTPGLRQRAEAELARLEDEKRPKA